MRTVSDLISELSKFPSDAICHAHEGEFGGGIAITGNKTHDFYMGFIHCSEGEKNDPPTEKMLRGSVPK